MENFSSLFGFSDDSTQVWFKTQFEERLRAGARSRDAESQFAFGEYGYLQEQGFFYRLSELGDAWRLSELINVSRILGGSSLGFHTTYFTSMSAAGIIFGFGATSLKRRVLKDMQNGHLFCSLAMTESLAGFDIAKGQTIAREAEGGYILSGQKNYISNAGVAKHLCIFAKCLDVNGEDKGMSCFYVARDSAGVRTKNLEKLGHREANTADIILDSVLVPSECLIGKVGQGYEILARALGRGKTLIAASAVGAAIRACEVSISHLQSRRKGDTSLMDKASLQQLFAKYFVEIQAAWLLIEKSAKAWDAGSSAAMESSAAKLFAADLAVRVVSECLEMTGAAAYMSGHELERMYRDVKLLEIYEGSTQVLELQLSKFLFPKAASKGRHLKVAA